MNYESFKIRFSENMSGLKFEIFNAYGNKIIFTTFQNSKREILVSMQGENSGVFFVNGINNGQKFKLKYVTIK